MTYVNANELRDAVLKLDNAKLISGSSIMYVIDKLETDVVETATAFWVETEDARYKGLCVCTHCTNVHRYKTNYCPSCGAKMKNIE